MKKDFTKNLDNAAPGWAKKKETAAPSLERIILSGKPSSESGKALLFEATGTDVNLWRLLSSTIELSSKSEFCGKEELALRASNLRAWIFAIFRRKGIAGSGYSLWSIIEKSAERDSSAFFCSLLFPAYVEIGAKIPFGAKKFLFGAAPRICSVADDSAWSAFRELASDEALFFNSDAVLSYPRLRDFFLGLPSDSINRISERVINAVSAASPEHRRTYEKATATSLIEAQGSAYTPLASRLLGEKISHFFDESERPSFRPKL